MLNVITSLTQSVVFEVNEPPQPAAFAELAHYAVDTTIQYNTNHNL